MLRSTTCSSRRRRRWTQTTEMKVKVTVMIVWRTSPMRRVQPVQQLPRPSRPTSLRAGAVATAIAPPQPYRRQPHPLTRTTPWMIRMMVTKATATATATVTTTPLRSHRCFRLNTMAATRSAIRGARKAAAKTSSTTMTCPPDSSIASSLGICASIASRKGAANPTSTCFGRRRSTPAHRHALSFVKRLPKRTVERRSSWPPSSVVVGVGPHSHHRRHQFLVIITAILAAMMTSRTSKDNSKHRNQTKHRTSNSNQPANRGTN
mmetsp:Transcript_19131/g.54334  ORF Transcript_19131/g.54334 Transcript_19131/m.54334 type:complete len:263 (+) Transcript_19131:602-1390(+)